MSRRENNQHMARLYLKALLFLGMMGAFLAWVIASSPALPTMHILLISVGIAAPLTVAAFALARRRVERVFLERDPEKVINALRAGRVGPWVAAAWSAYLEAWVYTLYGRFDSAQRALDRIHWASEPAMVRAAATSVEALLCFLHTRDPDRGLALAQDAHEKADMSSAIPGAKSALAAHEALILIGKVMNGPSNGKIIAKLAAHARTPHIGSRIIATWGLAVAQARAGDPARARATLEQCRKMAPYCEPLLSLPVAVKVDSQRSVTAGEGAGDHVGRLTQARVRLMDRENAL